MKTIKIENGEIRKGFEFGDLNKEAQDKVLEEQINFEIEVMDENSSYYYLAQEMEKYQTPWFLGSEIYDKHKQDLIETIEANNYLFDEYGEMLPVSYHMNKNRITKTTFGRKEYLCIID